MGMQPSNIHHSLYQGPKLLVDPGDAGTITATQDLQICEMVSAGAGETRTLANPTKPGIRLTVRVKTDGGSIILSAANGFNVLVETEATFSEASDFLSLISVTTTGTTCRWEILEGNAGVTLA